MKLTKQTPKDTNTDDQYTIRITDNKTGEVLELNCGLFLIAANVGWRSERDTKNRVYVGGYGSVAQFSSLRRDIDAASRFHFGTGHFASIGVNGWHEVGGDVLKGY